MCQIDHLKELPTDRERLSALQRLPPTLGVTYERILERVNQRNSRIQDIVKRTLCLLSYTGIEMITIQELREAVSIHDDSDISDLDSIVTEEEIALRCSSLIRKSTDGTRFEFAHFTVREFLRSDSLCGTPLEKYWLADSNISTILTSTSVQFLLQPVFRERIRDPASAIDLVWKIWSNHPFFVYASLFWATNKEHAWWNDPASRRLVEELCTPPKTTNFICW